MARRSKKLQARRRASPRSIGQRDPSLRWPHLYDILRAKGYSKSKAARISNSRLRYRKKGRLQGLPYQQADNPAALAKLRKGRTASSLVAACYDKSCAPPPAGKGGSSKGGPKGRTAKFKKGGMVERVLKGAKGPKSFKDYDRGGRKAVSRAPWTFTLDSIVFACYDKSCAPPPVGKGGSSKGGAKGSGVTGQKFQPITASEARGDSKAVSAEEFQRLAGVGQTKLDAMRSNTHKNALADESVLGPLKAQGWQEVQSEWGGMTIESKTGEPLPQGVDRYAMTVKESGMETVSIPIEGMNQQAFDSAMGEAVAKFDRVLKYEGHHLGVFRDDDVGRIDFDPVIVVDNLSDVHTIGAATRAIGGAYNFADGQGYWPPHVKD